MNELREIQDAVMGWGEGGENGKKSMQAVQSGMWRSAPEGFGCGGRVVWLRGGGAGGVHGPSTAQHVRK